MEHTTNALASLFDKLAKEERELAKRSDDLGRYGVAFEHNCKANAYQRASLLARFKPEFDKEAERLGEGEEVR